VLRHHSDNENKIYALRYFDTIEWTKDNVEPKTYSQTLVESCFRQNEVIIIGDTQLVDNLKDLKNVKNGGGRSIAVIPLTQDKIVVGVIYLDNQQLPHNFDLLQIPFLTTYAVHTSIALHNTLLYKRAITDDLTQLYTRQHIDEGLELQIQRAQTEDQELSILILDLDHFKKINDTYGHTSGDQVLQTFSNLIKKHIRDCDMAGRFGGEEFVVILADTSLKQAEVFAEKIRCAIEKESIVKDEQVIRVTVSIGVASYRKKHGNKALLLFEDADKALYQAKEQGRNQTVCFS
jgi:diguanylate cyclase (GGDEF)-like protein